MFPDNNFHAEKVDGRPVYYAMPLPYGAYKGIIYYGDRFTTRKYPLNIEQVKLGSFGYLAFTDTDHVPEFAFEDWAGYLLGDSNVEIEMYQRSVYGYKLIFGLEEWVMEGVQWLFEIGAFHWSTQKAEFASQEYDRRVIPASFSGIEMRGDIGGGMIAPSDLDFEVSDPDAEIDEATLRGQSITIKLVMNEVLTRSWKFKVKRAVRYYGKIHIYAVDILQDFLIGDFPLTPHPKELWPSTDTDPEELDEYRIPWIFGTAYLPVQSVFTGVERYYVLGLDDTYTISEVHTPKEWQIQAAWPSGSYDFIQSTNAGYRLAQFEIFEDENGDRYPGLWRAGAGFLRPLVQMSKSSTASTTNPASVISALLQALGVPAADIDFDGSIYTTRGIAFNGGIWQTEAREMLLSNLLAQCDSYLSVTDKVRIHMFAKTPVETFAKSEIIRTSFRNNMQTQYTANGGRIAWAISGKPQDDLQGKASVPASQGGTVTELDGETLYCRFVSDSVVAQTAGVLHFQKRLLPRDGISFESSGLKMATMGSIIPGQVVRVDDPLFGGQTDCIVQSVTIGKGLSVNVSAVRLEVLEDWDDITVSPIAVPVDEIAPPAAPIMSYEIDGEMLVVTWTTGRMDYPIEIYRLSIDGEEVLMSKERRYTERITWFGTKVYSVEAIDISDRVGPEGVIDVVIDDLVTPTALATTGKPYEIRIDMTYTKTTLFTALEIWASKNVNDRTQAENIKETGAKFYAHEGIEPTDTWYYWIRTKDVFDNVSDFFPASPTGGIAGTSTLVKTEDVAENAISNGAVYTWSTSQAGNGAYQSWSNNFQIDISGRVLVHLSFRQGYTDGVRTTGLRIYIGGVLSNDVGTVSGSAQDIIAISASRIVPAGTVNIEVQWYGEDNTVGWANRVMIAQLFKR